MFNKIKKKWPKINQYLKIHLLKNDYLYLSYF